MIQTIVLENHERHRHGLTQPLHHVRLRHPPWMAPARPIHRPLCVVKVHSGCGGRMAAEDIDAQRLGGDLEINGP
eukprot:4140744-Prymnesium_polylepis.1